MAKAFLQLGLKLGKQPTKPSEGQVINKVEKAIETLPDSVPNKGSDKANTKMIRQAGQRIGLGISDRDIRASQVLSLFHSNGEILKQDMLHHMRGNYGKLQQIKSGVRLNRNLRPSVYNEYGFLRSVTPDDMTDYNSAIYGKSLKENRDIGEDEMWDYKTYAFEEYYPPNNYVYNHLNHPRLHSWFRAANLGDTMRIFEFQSDVNDLVKKADNKERMKDLPGNAPALAMHGLLEKHLELFNDSRFDWAGLNFRGNTEEEKVSYVVRNIKDALEEDMVGTKFKEFLKTEGWDGVNRWTEKYINLRESADTLIGDANLAGNYLRREDKFEKISAVSELDPDTKWLPRIIDRALQIAQTNKKSYLEIQIADQYSLTRGDADLVDAKRLYKKLKNKFGDDLKMTNSEVYKELNILLRTNDGDIDAADPTKEYLIHMIKTGEEITTGVQKFYETEVTNSLLKKLKEHGLEYEWVDQTLTHRDLSGGTFEEVREKGILRIKIPEEPIVIYETSSVNKDINNDRYA